MSKLSAMAATESPAQEARTSIRQLASFLPKQNQALDAMYRFRFILYGGAAGPGKSYFLRWAALHYLMECYAAGHEGVHVGLFSETYNELRDRQINKIKREFPLSLGRVKRTDAEGLHFALNAEYGGGVISLRNLDDPAKYQSAEFAGIFVDELTKNPRQTFDDLRFRLRWPGIEHTVFVGATNPKGIGHKWVKKLWVDKNFSGDDAKLARNQFAFIRALPRDNPHLSQQYWDDLDSLPENMRKAFVDGDWNIFEGQEFTEFSIVTHVKKPFRLDPSWGRWAALDWGYDHPMVCHWAVRIPRGAYIEPPGEEPFTATRNHVAIYREYVKSRQIAQDQALTIKHLSEGEHIGAIYGPPDMWKHFGQKDDLCIADEYSAVGVNLSQANNDRIAGVARLHRALNHEHGPPELWIFETCPDIIEVLPGMMADPLRGEDVIKVLGDDSYDSCLVGETLILTDQGERRIDSIQAGDRVWTRDGLHTVERAWLANDDAPVRRVELSNGRILTGTSNHRIWSGTYWRDLKVLEEGDSIPYWATETTPERWVNVEAVEDAGRAPVYDLSVMAVPEYVANGVLVHNCRYLMQEADRFAPQEAAVPQHWQIGSEPGSQQFPFQMPGMKR